MHQQGMLLKLKANEELLQNVYLFTHQMKEKALSE
jgi:hypothetical protein